MTEYAVILALVAVLVVAALSTLGRKANNVFEYLGELEQTAEVDDPETPEDEGGCSRW